MSKRSSKNSLADRQELAAALGGWSPSPSRPASRNEQEVADLAYQRWVERGGPLGSPEEDWFEAERELQSRTHSS